MPMSMGGLGAAGVATVVVAADGSGDFDNIQEALDSLPTTGGVVYVREGTYVITAPISVTKQGVAIIGAGRSTIVSNECDPAAHCIDWVSNYGYISQIRLGAAAGSGGTTAIYSTQTGPMTIRDVWVDSHTGGFYVARNMSYFLVDGFEVIGAGQIMSILAPANAYYINMSGIQGTCTSWAFNLSKCNYVTLTNSNIAAAGTVGLSFENCTNLKIASNTLTATAIFALSLDTCNKVTITGNTIPDSSKGILLDTCTNTTISGNTSYSASDVDIELYACSASSVTGNVCNSAGNYNIRARATCSNIAITGNVISGATAGIHLADTDNCTIVGNACTGCTTDIHISNAACDNNVVVANKAAAITDAGTGTLVAHNQ